MRVPAPMKAKDLTGLADWSQAGPRRLAGLRPHLGFGKVMEIKYDGDRASLHLRDGRSSFGVTRSNSFPYWAAIDGAKVTVDGAAQAGTILDGEFLAGTLPGEVRPPRDRSSGWYGSAPPNARKYELQFGRPRFVAFDLLASAGQDWTRRPYRERRAELARVVDAIREAYPGCGIELAEQFPASTATIERLWAEGHEGVIIKEQDQAPGCWYHPGKRPPGAWAKVKATADISLVTTGAWKAGEGSWADRVGSVELALWTPDGLIPVGYCAVKPELARAYTDPRTGGLRPGKAGLVWEVRLNGLTARLEDGGQMMHPRYLWERPDQAPEDCGTDQLSALPQPPAAARRRARKTA